MFKKNWNGISKKILGGSHEAWYIHDRIPAATEKKQKPTADLLQGCIPSLILYRQMTDPGYSANQEAAVPTV